MAYVLMCALRRIGLHGADFANATCGTLRLKVLKIGAIVRISVRRIRVAMASASPAAQIWGLAAVRLALAALARLIRPPQASQPRQHSQAHRDHSSLLPAAQEKTSADRFLATQQERSLVKKSVQLHHTRRQLRQDSVRNSG
jgi:hypothetical protein